MIPQGIHMIHISKYLFTKSRQTLDTESGETDFFVVTDYLQRDIKKTARFAARRQNYSAGPNHQAIC